MPARTNNMPKRVLLIISNPKQAAYRLRWEQLLPRLAQNGIEVDVAVRTKGMLARRKLAQSAGPYDAVVLQRKLLDGWEARLLRRSAKRVILDIDDAVMFHAHRVSAFSQWRQARRFNATAKILDLVVAGNDYLAEQFAARGCPCRILPTTVDLDQYLVRQHQASTPIRLVWIGSRSTLPYLQQFLPYLERAQTSDCPLELVTVADGTVQSAVIAVRHIPWSLPVERRALVEGDIGIAPTPQDRWAQGKCGFKIIQYMASALPVIASPVGANAQIVVEHQTGLLPQTGPEWSAAIRKLAADASLRQTMGTAGRERVAQHYSLPRAVEAWTQWLAE